MKGNIKAGLIAIAAWATAFLVIGAAASVCSSCGTKQAPAIRADCR